MNDRIDKLKNLLKLKEAIRNMVDKNSEYAVSEARLGKFMESISDSYLKQERV